ncbi:MAG: glycine--tRNA ligase [Candidatus Thermoplasmatota archaeon]
MQDIYERLMTLAKRRGFIHPSFEIYGGIAGFYDYGPLGAQLKYNVEEIWRRFYILQEGFLEVYTPTITLYEVLQASGHVEEFTDLTIDCEHCRHSYKVEDIIDKNQTVDQAIKEGDIKCPTCRKKLSNPYHTNLMFSTKIGVGEGRRAFLRPETAQGIFTNFHLLYRYAREKLPFGVVQIGRGYRNEISPRQGVIRQREFSMAEAEIFFDPLDKTHPRFKEIKKTMVTLVNDDDREMRISLEEAVDRGVINNQALAYYMCITQEFLLTCGIDKNKFRFRKHKKDELAHYATECWDAELYSERFGWVECVGIADRSAYDINAHIKASGVDMYANRRYDKPRTTKIKRIVAKMDALGPLFKKEAARIKDLLDKMNPDYMKDKVTVNIDGRILEIPEHCYEIVESTERIAGEKFIPHVIEPSYGIDRIIYFLLEHNYRVEKKNEEEYYRLSLKSCIAPIKTGVFPLVNEEPLMRIAKDIDRMLKDAGVITYYDENGSIGRRYARMDEVGTPLCVTVDHESLEDATVTIRDRDTTKQERIKIKNIVPVIKERLHT